MLSHYQGSCGGDVASSGVQRGGTAHYACVGDLSVSNWKTTVTPYCCYCGRPGGPSEMARGSRQLEEGAAGDGKKVRGESSRRRELVFIGFSTDRGGVRTAEPTHLDANDDLLTSDES
ncbi:hypothetical protein BHE74_00009697 [Ensete ventricosum]|nr:hypothetical protein BHE74_00009697 [Ensete ventricosum]